MLILTSGVHSVWVSEIVLAIGCQGAGAAKRPDHQRSEGPTICTGWAYSVTLSTTRPYICKVTTHDITKSDRQNPILIQLIRNEEWIELAGGRRRDEASGWYSEVSMIPPIFFK